MSSAETASATAHAPGDPVTAPPALLRGTARGLEIIISASADPDAITAAITARLAEAPAFFRDSDVRIRVDGGPLAAGCLARLDEVAARFALRIVEVSPGDRARRDDRVVLAAWPPIPALPSGTDIRLASGTAPIATADSPCTSTIAAPGDASAASLASTIAAPQASDASAASLTSTTTAVVQAAGARAASLAGDMARAAEVIAGTSSTELAPSVPHQPSLPLVEPSGPVIDVPPPSGAAAEAVTPEPTAEQLELALRALEPTIEIIEPEPVPEPSRLVIGPVRSGVILEHRGHLVIFGDVNPGAEVRAEGNIVVLGRLRGTAHAGIGAPAGFILALRLQPQQLRIGRTVARASDSDRPGTEPEIAHIAGGTIVVERYTGKLPSGLAATI